MSEQNKAVIRRLIDEVWNQRAFDAADELFAPKAIIYESGVALPGAEPAIVKKGIGALCTAYPDIRVTIDDMIAADDKVVVCWRLYRHPPGRNARNSANQTESCSKRHRNLSIRWWQSC